MTSSCQTKWKNLSSALHTLHPYALLTLHAHSIALLESEKKETTQRYWNFWVTTTKFILRITFMITFGFFPFIVVEPFIPTSFATWQDKYKAHINIKMSNAQEYNKIIDHELQSKSKKSLLNSSRSSMGKKHNLYVHDK